MVSIPVIVSDNDPLNPATQDDYRREPSKTPPLKVWNDEITSPTLSWKKDLSGHSPVNPRELV